jgi:NADH:ubiquinone oxidoreductase subunit C
MNKSSDKITSILSITELFSNANWLEREVAELNGVFFSGKKDLRNLMLQYGDTNSPFQKFFPSIGIKEISYDSINDLLLQTPISIQF